MTDDCTSVNRQHFQLWKPPASSVQTLNSPWDFSSEVCRIGRLSAYPCRHKTVTRSLLVDSHGDLTSMGAQGQVFPLWGSVNICLLYKLQLKVPLIIYTCGIIPGRPLKSMEILFQAWINSYLQSPKILVSSGNLHLWEVKTAILSIWKGGNLYVNVLKFQMKRLSCRRERRLGATDSSSGDGIIHLGSWYDNFFLFDFFLTST